MDMNRIGRRGARASALAAGCLLLMGPAFAQLPAGSAARAVRPSDVVGERSTNVAQFVRQVVRIPLRDESGAIRVIMTWTEERGKRGPVTFTDASGLELGRLSPWQGQTMYSLNTDLFGLNEELGKLRQRVADLERKVKP
ncbi:MAG: hypothetical protein JO013_10925 [Alphaproteobacteria bacterium]|nr:hypothetical protein [Alphaproteobacteria bacterium]